MLRRHSPMDLAPLLASLPENGSSSDHAKVVGCRIESEPACLDRRARPVGSNKAGHSHHEDAPDTLHIAAASADTGGRAQQDRLFLRYIHALLAE